MKRRNNWTDTDVAILTGVSPDELARATSGEFDPFLRLAIQLHEAARRKLTTRGRIIQRAADLLERKRFTAHHLSLLNSIGDTLSDEEIIEFLT